MESENIQNTITSDMPVKSTSKLIMVLIILIAILFVSSGFLVFENMKLSQQIAGMKVSTSPIPVALTDPTADWKTYTATSFSVKLPLDFQEDPRSSGDNINFENSNPKAELNTVFINGNWQNSVPACSSAQLCYERVLAEAKGAFTANNANTYSTVSSKILGEVVAGVQFDTPSQVSPGTNLGGYSDLDFYIDNNSDVIQLSFHIIGDPSMVVKQKSTMDQILSTFKFTN